MAGGPALGSSAGVDTGRVILANLKFTSPPAFSRDRLAAGSRAICALTGRGVKDCNITREQRTTIYPGFPKVTRRPHKMCLMVIMSVTLLFGFDWVIIRRKVW